MNESLKRLEEKIAHLERHVTEQDKVMLEFGEELARLRRELKLFRERTAPSSPTEVPDDGADDRPPHY